MFGTKETFGPLSYFAKILCKEPWDALWFWFLLRMHVKSLFYSCSYHLRNIANLNTIFSHPKHDYSCFCFLMTRLLQHTTHTVCLLQVVQKAAARLLLKSSRFPQVITIWMQVHLASSWFQTAILLRTWRALHREAPEFSQMGSSPLRPMLRFYLWFHILRWPQRETELFVHRHRDSEIICFRTCLLIETYF